MAREPPPYRPHRHPHIHLLTIFPDDLTAFQAALRANPLPDSYSISYHIGSLRQLHPSINFDAVVSPANSYGRMDGGFDDALSRAFSPPGEYLALTHAVQKKLWEDHRGFAPPGTCTLVPFDFTAPPEAAGQEDQAGQAKWGCRVVAVCPTMKVPQPVAWDKEVVYECIWSLLCALQKWNESCDQEQKINSILMTPLATATGGYSAAKWATQTLLAMRHFDQSSLRKDKWSQLSVQNIQDLQKEVAVTYDM